MADPIRVLFLRSHSKICALSFIANGLQHCQRLEFEQYPPLPESSRAKLNKLPDPEHAWEELNMHLIPTYRELREKLTTGYFSCVLLADYDGWLTHVRPITRIEKFRLFARSARHEIRTHASYLTAFPMSIAELCQHVPVVVVDLIDHPYLLQPQDEHLLRHCTAYCKREIPYNRFVLYHALDQFRALSRSGKDAQRISLLDKVYGIPLGIPDTKFYQLRQKRTDTQDIDVFWAGRISNTLRARAEGVLKDFRDNTSRNIVMPTERLSFQEFCEMIARSKVTISIAGGGWDCDRHYEAVALGSVPFMNRPTTDAVWWHEMPDAIFFDNNFSNFTARLEELLGNDSLRQACLQKLEQHVRAHALWSNIVEYMVTTALTRRGK